nr:IS1182 family transposase [Sedimentibacter sp.]
MLTKNNENQPKVELVLIENLVKKDHILRKIDEYIDFNFIYDLVEDKYYLDNGRPSVDPVVLFKIILIGYLFGIRSERRLIEEIHHNVAYRWFLGYGLEDKIPGASTISQNRRRRFTGTDIFEKIFDNIVGQAIKHKLITGKVMYVDSTHIKANANIGKFTNEQVEVALPEYVDELEKAVTEAREAHGQKELKKNKKTVEVKNRKVSTTDSDSGYMFRDRKPKGFFYLNHMAVDGENNLIASVLPTTAAINDAVPFLGIVEKLKERYNVKYVGADAGYYTTAIAKGLKELGITASIAKRLGPKPKGKMSKLNFVYIEERDIYVCPQDHSLNYKTTTREGYKEYRSQNNICKECPIREKCIYDKQTARTIRRHVWQEYLTEIDRFKEKTELGARIYKRRKETIERAFADLKELHGFRYARFRGIEKMKEQCLLTAAAYNIKKIATILGIYLRNFIYYCWNFNVFSYSNTF